MRVALIGYGNTLRGDDALGPLAVERLREQLPGPQYVIRQQLGPELAGLLAECDLAIFVDASVAGAPGEVHVEQLSPEQASEMTQNMTHHVTPVTLLAISKELYAHAPRTILVTAVGASFENFEGLSPQASRALDEICELVPTLIGDFPAMW
jgi:hydrogenase maturation protease